MAKLARYGQQGRWREAEDVESCTTMGNGQAMYADANKSLF
jgi:hypothetical protein